MSRRPLVSISLPVTAIALFAATAAGAHSLTAQGALTCTFPPCADTHLEGHWATG
jgi:hypothetical protein